MVVAEWMDLSGLGRVPKIVHGPLAFPRGGHPSHGALEVLGLGQVQTDIAKKIRQDIVTWIKDKAVIFIAIGGVISMIGAQMSPPTSVAVLAGGGVLIILGLSVFILDLL